MGAIGAAVMYIFQFHYGSIKADLGVDLPIELLEFQFHYGSIKAIHTVIQPAFFLNFNSTMVRLKRKSSHRQAQAGIYFNSTMVRLKPKKQSSTSANRNIFQFHYGSIKASDSAPGIHHPI